MASPRPSLPIHLLILAAIGVLALLVGGIYFLRGIVTLVKDYHNVCVLSFMGVVALWTYWAVFHLFKRRVDSEGDGNS